MGDWRTSDCALAQPSSKHIHPHTLLHTHWRVWTSEWYLAWFHTHKNDMDTWFCCPTNFKSFNWDFPTVEACDDIRQVDQLPGKQMITAFFFFQTNFSSIQFIRWSNYCTSLWVVQNEKPVFSKDGATFFITLPIKHGSHGSFRHLTMMSVQVLYIGNTFLFYYSYQFSLSYLNVN